jgi:precorrin-6B methylase 2
MRSHKEEFKYEAIQVQVNRLEAVGPYDMAKAINPIYIVTCKKIK